jgi:hypothetical protein
MKMDPFANLKAEDIADKAKLLQQQDLLDAVHSRIRRSAGGAEPDLALSMADGLMSLIWQIEATVSSLAMVGLPVGPLNSTTTENCRRQLGRIELALAAAAEAGGNTDIAAPATPDAIDAFLAHVDESWVRFPDEIFHLGDAVEVGLDARRFVLKKMLTDFCIGAKWAMVTLGRHQRLRMAHPLVQAPIELEAVVRKSAARKRGELGAGRAINIRADAGGAQIVGDPTFTEALIDELIKNALLFSEETKGVGVSLTVEGRSLALFVDDEGPGLKEVSPTDSLKPFKRGAFQASGDISQCRLGLGLANADLTARRSGWEIDFAKGRSDLRPVVLFPLR